MTYVCQVGQTINFWSFNTRKNVLCSNGNLPGPTSIGNLRMGFNTLRLYDAVTKLCKQQALSHTKYFLILSHKCNNYHKFILI
jgi:hypothetical protein